MALKPEILLSGQFIGKSAADETFVTRPTSEIKTTGDPEKICNFYGNRKNRKLFYRGSYARFVRHFFSLFFKAQHRLPSLVAGLFIGFSCSVDFFFSFFLFNNLPNGYVLWTEQAIPHCF